MPGRESCLRLRVEGGGVDGEERNRGRRKGEVVEREKKGGYERNLG